jgi:DNA-binding NtrC family response regulator
VREKTLAAHEKAAFRPGDLIELGSTMFIVQRPPRAQSQRHVWSHGYFEGRLAEECARAARYDLAFAVVRVHVDPGAGARDDAHVRTVLAGAVDPSDVLATYGSGDWEILLVGATSKDAAASEGRTAEARAGDVARAVESGVRSFGMHARIGIALYGRDGRDPSSLLEAANTRARGEEPARRGPAIVIRDPRMQQLHKLLERVALGSIHVLLLGETGVGKEVMAAELHALSPRAGQPFVALNCAALSESLLESELFGHERGAFTGAVAHKKGLLESATGGTLFLDEVGELPMATQVKLLRVLEEREVRRVGGLKSTIIDVRIVSATNRDLEAEIAAGRFRQDLYFRLNGVSLVIPPLRERPMEIEELAHVFVDDAARREKRTPAPRISAEAMQLLRNYSWPGNVRELRNVIERAVLLCTDDAILSEHLPVEKMQAVVSIEQPPASAPPTLFRPPTIPPALGRSKTLPPFAPHPSTQPPGKLDADATQPGEWKLKDVVDGFEKERILDALEKCAGNQSRAAKLLGISRNTLIARLKQYGIRRPRAGRDE